MNHLPFESLRNSRTLFFQPYLNALRNHSDSCCTRILLPKTQRANRLHKNKKSSGAGAASNEVSFRDPAPNSTYFAFCPPSSHEKNIFFTEPKLDRLRSRAAHGPIQSPSTSRYRGTRASCPVTSISQMVCPALVTSKTRPVFVSVISVVLSRVRKAPHWVIPP